MRARMREFVRGLAPLRERWLAVAALLPVIILAILFWRVDVNDPLTMSALLLDRVLQAATVLCLPISVAVILVGPWSAARLGAAAGGFISILLGGSASLAALRPPVNVLPTMASVASLLCGIGLTLHVTRHLVLSRRWKVSLLAPLALLPAIQFWHATSFVPGHLSNALSVTSKASLEGVSAESRQGAIEVVMTNSGDVGALILAAEVTSCFRASNRNLNYDVEALYADRKECETKEILDELSSVDAHSTWTFHQAFSAPINKPLLQMVVQVWYARSDRLRIAGEQWVSEAERKTCSRSHYATYRIDDEAKFKGVVQRQRLISYEGIQDDGAMYFWITAKGERLCSESKYDLGEQVGTAEVRMNFEDWLNETNK